MAPRDSPLPQKTCGDVRGIACLGAWSPQGHPRITVLAVFAACSLRSGPGPPRRRGPWEGLASVHDSLQNVLREFLDHDREVAVVVDEYGNTTGLVSLEDIIEVIVGQISDEFDRPRGPSVEELSPTRFIVDGRLHLDELRRRGMEAEIEDDLVTTVSGLLMEIGQRVPKSGERFQAGNTHFRVLSAGDRRIHRVLVELTDDDTEPGNAD